MPSPKTQRHRRMQTFLLGRAYATVGDKEKISLEGLAEFGEVTEVSADQLFSW